VHVFGGMVERLTRMRTAPLRTNRADPFPMRGLSPKACFEARSDLQARAMPAPLAPARLPRSNAPKLPVPPPPRAKAKAAARLWEIGYIVKLVEAAKSKPGKRGPYKKHTIDPAH
jgi:hypothetical protein